MFNSNVSSNNDLFQLALGLKNPWLVSEVNFSEKDNKLDIHLACTKGSKFSCPECGQSLGVYDNAKRTWRHLNFFQYETHLHADLPRIQCDKSAPPHL